MSKLTLVLALCAAVGIVSLGNLAHADKIKDITCAQFIAMDANAQNNIVYWVEGADVAYTCAELIEVDIVDVPQVVYWLDGFNWAGDPQYDAAVEWTPVEIDTVYVECQKNPSTKARKVVKKHSKSK